MKDIKYQTYSHAKTRLRYHLIFSTKFRRKCLDQIHDSVINAFRKVEQKSNFDILAIELDKDHAHMLVSFKPCYSIEQVVRRLKQMSTFYIYQKEYDYLKKFYWKQKNVLWTHGYFCSTIGEVSEKKIIEYIKNQG